MANIYGQSLNFAAIGIGSDDHFGVLRSMVDKAEDFECIPQFKLPSMICCIDFDHNAGEMSDEVPKKQLQIIPIKRESKTQASNPLSSISGFRNLFYVYGKDSNWLMYKGMV